MRCEDALTDLIRDLAETCPVCGRALDPETYGEIETSTELVSVCESCIESAAWTETGRERHEWEMAVYLGL